MFPLQHVDTAQKYTHKQKTMERRAGVKGRGRESNSAVENLNSQVSLFENYFIMFMLTNLCAFYLRTFDKVFIKNYGFLLRAKFLERASRLRTPKRNEMMQNKIDFKFVASVQVKCKSISGITV